MGFPSFSASFVHLDVSENSGTPKSSIINYPFRGTPIFGNTHLVEIGIVCISFAFQKILGLLDFTGAGRIEGVSDLNVDAPSGCEKDELR